jgi:hypothetical protein
MEDLTKVKIKVPLGKYKSDRTEAQALNELKLTKDRAGAMIKKISDIHNIPQDLALAFTCVETGGLAIRSGDGVSYGMMQCNAATLDGVIKFAFKYGMPIDEFKYIYYACKPAFTLIKGAQVPTLESTTNLNPFRSDFVSNLITDVTINQKPVNQVLKYTNPNHILTTGGGFRTPTNIYNIKMNKQPEFGIHIGCMYLFELMSKSMTTEAGNEFVRLDWVVNGYNGGYYSRFNPWISKLQEKYSPDIWLNQKGLPSVTFAYVKRLAGVGGYMEMFKTGKFVF